MTARDFFASGQLPPTRGTRAVKDRAEEIVSHFYDTQGWQTQGGITEDARRWEDLREYATEYVSKCRLRVLRHIPASGINLLDMASGPIQYDEYLQYSTNFSKRYCVDLSSIALEGAKQKIGDHGVFLHGSFFDIPLGEEFFDCTVSLHTIYHIDKDKQEEAVRKLISVTKPGNPVIIVYSNPHTLIGSVRSFLPVRALRKTRSLVTNRNKITKEYQEPTLYFYAHPLEWWNRFTDVADVQVLPWRSFSSDDQRRLVPNNQSGRIMFRCLFDLEERFPDFFARHFQFPMIILTKRYG